MLAKFTRHSILAAIALTATLATVRLSIAAPVADAPKIVLAQAAHGEGEAPVDAGGHGADAGHEAGTELTEGDHADGAGHGAEGGHEGGHESAGPRPVFEPEHATWFNVIARNIFATPEEKEHMAQAEKDYAALQAKAAGGAKLSKEETDHLKAGVHYVTKYDWLLYTPLLWLLLAIAMVSAAKKAKLRPSGKAASLANTVEAAVDGFQNYLIGVMGEGLARKYAALIASFFFTILVSNWLGLIPGMMAASAQPAVPIGISLVAFLAVHVIAIK
ncbi:F0F1 ATP synthase subunit A, partial [bacterium]